MNYGKRGASEKYKAAVSNSAKMYRKAFVITFKVILICILAVVILGISAGVGLAKGIIDSAPDISQVDVSPSGYSTTIYDSSGNVITTLVASGSNRIYVEIEEIPVDLQHAFVAIEDERFYTHSGIDTKGIARAAMVAITSKDFSQGASTITQQLLKNNVFKDWTEETYLPEKLKRKIQEQYLAVELEKTMSKQLILENYLNTINLGQNTLGVQAAAKRYFNKDVSELNLAECAVIAAITQNPSKYNPVTHPEYNEERRNKVLNNMLEQEYISKEQYDAAMADNVYERIQNINDETETSSPYSYYVDAVIDQIMTDLQEQKGYTQTQVYNLLYSGGLSIYTAQDMSIQQICDEEFNNPDNFPEGSQVSLTYRLTVTHPDGSADNYNEKSLLAYFNQSNADYSLIYGNANAANNAVEEYKKSVIAEGDTIDEQITLTPQPQASMVIMDQHNGYVKAIVGGRGEKEASLTLNRATNTVRQPGSTFKVLAAYAPALDSAGKTLASTYVDEPYNYSNGRPVSNYYSGYLGTQTIRTAIEKSMNIIAVKCLTEITPQLGYDYLLNFGFTTLVENRTYADGSTKSDIGQPLALGGLTDGVKNIELTAAYATIANGGVYEKPVFYTKIVDHDGNVLMDNTKTKTHTVLKESTAFLLTSAMQDVVKNGTGKIVNFDTMSIAGKTGTTSQTYDVWFAGFTPYYTCSVWGGYDVNTSMYDASYHKGLWKAVMQRVHENLEYKEFEMPDSVTSVQICQKSGKLANKGCPAVTEFFEKGTEPVESCGLHVSSYSKQDPSNKSDENNQESDNAAQENEPSENTDTGAEEGAAEGTE